MNIKFFKTPSDFGKWLSKNHASEKELWVGYYKKGSGIPSIDWPQSVDEALCFGWIDGIRKSIDDKSYKIRFTPRKTKSHWSDVNIKRVKELTKLGLMQPAGVEAYKKRDENKSRRASYEQKNVTLDKKFESEIKKNKAAWKYFQALAPSYKKQYIWWLQSAKREETKLKRLEILIQSSAQGEKIPPMRYGEKK